MRGNAAIAPFLLGGALELFGGLKYGGAGCGSRIYKKLWITVCRNRRSPETECLRPVRGFAPTSRAGKVSRQKQPSRRHLCAGAMGFLRTFLRRRAAPGSAAYRLSVIGNWRLCLFTYFAPNTGFAVLHFGEPWGNFVRSAAFYPVGRGP